jgi:hypothetical protein
MIITPRSGEVVRQAVTPAGERAAIRLPSGPAISEGPAEVAVETEGVAIRFSLPPDGLACELRAVPGRGYEGRCGAAEDSAVAVLIPPVHGMLLPWHEERLAREAAPADMAAGVTVYVLQADGYRERARGGNGFICYIERPRPVDLWPICHAELTSSKLLPVDMLRARLRAAGVAEAAIVDSVSMGYFTGRFRAPPDGAIGYMLSPNAWTAGESGEPVFIAPHWHLYAPWLSPAEWGLPDDASTLRLLGTRIERHGRPDASIIVGAPRRATER